jgi:DNA polymerase-3 subunit delta
VSAVVPVRLIKGSDDILRGEAFTRALEEAVDGGDRSLLVDEFDLDHAKLAAAIDAAQTPPFLTDHRVVVVRRLGRFSKNDEVASLVAYLEDPSPTTALVLVWEKTTLTSANDDGEPFTRTPKQPPALTKAISACGGVVIDADPAGRNLGGWVDAQLAEAGLSVEPKARDRITDVLGEDAGALREIIERLNGAYGTGERLRLDDVVGYLGEAGGVAPWDLTDAIDSGDVARSLEMLGRMMGAGGRHGLAVMASLQTHYLRMARLDGAGVRGEKDAAAVLGLKGSTFPAKKAMALGRKLGPAKVRRAVELLAQADLDLRGGKAWPNELVMEVLVARLARLSR